jgi:hypothetical protein
MGWLNADLSEGSLHSLRSIVSSLDHLATYYGIKGELSLLDGKVDVASAAVCSLHAAPLTATVPECAFRFALSSSLARTA